MSVLLFVCPETDREVSSNIDIDDDSFRTVRVSEIKCPDCNQIHNLFNLSLRLSDEVKPKSPAPT
jgi:acetone carboxylase gamma subunit